MSEELKVIISAEISKLKQGVESAKQQVKNLQNKFKEASKTIKEDLAKAGEGATNVAKKIAGGVAALGAALIGAAVGTEEYRNQQAQLKTAFEAAGASAATATETYNGLYRVLGDGGQAQEAAQHLAKLTTEEKALSEWTNICQGVYATFGASLPIESLTEAANETAKTGELTGALADALNWAGVSEDAFSEKLAACNTEAEREKLIRETLTGLYSDAAATYETNNAQILAQRDAQAALQEKLAAVGEAIAPVLTAFTNFGAQLLEKVSPIIQDLSDKYLPKLKEWLNKAADAVGSVIDWITNNWELVSSIGSVILAIVAALTAASTALKVVNGVMALFNANPIILAITAVIAIIVLCIKHWDDIKAAGKKAWDWIKNAWQNAGQWFSNIVAKIKQAFANIGEWFRNIFTKARDNVKNAFSSITGFFSGIWSKIQSIFSNVGTAIANGIKGAVVSAVNWILSKAAGIINGFIGALNFAIGIINKIPGVNIKALSKLEVPQLAKGGVVDSATLAVIGEQGKEMVMPLENNLQYLDKLAAMLASRMGGGDRPIVLQIDGKTFAQTTIDSINNLTRQTGTLGLAIV